MLLKRNVSCEPVTYCGERRKLCGRSTKANPPETESPFVWKGPDYPILSPGRYTVRGASIQGPEWVRRYMRWSLRLEFALVHEVGYVSAFFNGGTDPGRAHFGRQSNYYKAWVLANGEHPRTKQEMNPDVFLEGLFFQVQVETSNLDWEGNPKPEAEGYSRITRLLSATRP